MKSLLLVAHGSRRAEANLEIADLAGRLAERLSGPGTESGTESGAESAPGAINLVEHAFLELAEPSIPDGIQRCIDRGATSVRVVPYFLAKGTHVTDDIPEQVSIKQAAYPDMDIEIVDYLGTSDELIEVLLKLAH